MTKDVFKLDDFLASLEEDKEKIAEEASAEEASAEEASAEEASAEEASAEEASADAEKIAQLQEEGQIIARSFFEELEKLAVGDGPLTVNTETVKEPNEVSSVSVGDIKTDQTGKVTAVLNQLQQAVRSGGGDLTFTFNPGQPQPMGTSDETVLPHDVSKQQEEGAAAANMNKAAADKIIDNLYTKVYGEE